MDPEKTNIDHAELNAVPSSSDDESDNGGKAVPEYTKLRNPLAGMTDAQVIEDVEQFARDKGLEEHLGLLRNGGTCEVSPRS